MSQFVAVVGLAMILAGATFTINPALMRRVVGGLLRVRRLQLAIMIRIVLGMILILMAPDTNHPPIVMVIGLFIMITGIMIPIVGAKRVAWLSAWWLQKPDYLLRGVATLATLTGALLLWASI